LVKETKVYATLWSCIFISICIKLTPQWRLPSRRMYVIQL
jgi:hypothetical protein